MSPFFVASKLFVYYVSFSKVFVLDNKKFTSRYCQVHAASRTRMRNCLIKVSVQGRVRVPRLVLQVEVYSFAWIYHFAIEEIRKKLIKY